MFEEISKCIPGKSLEGFKDKFLKVSLDFFRVNIGEYLQ